MPIPNLSSLMLPLLRLAADGQEHKVIDVIDPLAKEFGLTEDEVNEMLPSGTEEKFKNRVYWARTYLKQAGLLEYPGRGCFKITDRGKSLMEENPRELTVKSLERYKDFLEFRNRKKTKEDVYFAGTTEVDITPEEKLESGYAELREKLVSEILEKIKSASPKFFEKLVIDLLLKMGYGGSRKDAGRAIGRPGDGGIDGIIKEDKLGLDIIYVQAKKWENTVGRPDIQAFAGSLEGVRAKRGIFITTSQFSDTAVDYVEKIEKKIVLIDGEMLSNLMIDHGLGVSDVVSYNVKKLDTDYFLEE